MNFGWRRARHRKVAVGWMGLSICCNYNFQDVYITQHTRSSPILRDPPLICMHLYAFTFTQIKLISKDQARRRNQYQSEALQLPYK